MDEHIIAINEKEKLARVDAFEAYLKSIRL